MKKSKESEHILNSWMYSFTRANGDFEKHGNVFDLFENCIGNICI